MRKFALTIVALLACHAVHAQYFCTAQGTELEYVNYDEAGQSISNETVSVTNVSRQGKKAYALYFTKIVENKVKNNTSYTLRHWTYEKGQSVCVEDLMYGPYIDSDSDPSAYNEEIRQALTVEKKWKGDNTFALADAAKAGESLPDRSFSYLNGMLKNEVTISGVSYMGKDSVNTTAGNFDCMKISYLKRTKVVLKTTTVRVNEWYAKGVGLVKSQSFDMKGKQYGKTLLVKIKEK